jgi:hypothetical protein
MDSKPLELAGARMLSRRSAFAGGVARLGALTLAGASTVLAQSATPRAGADCMTVFGTGWAGRDSSERILRGSNAEFAIRARRFR